MRSAETFCGSFIQRSFDCPTLTTGSPELKWGIHGQRAQVTVQTLTNPQVVTFCSVCYNSMCFPPITRHNYLLYCTFRRSPHLVHVQQVIIGQWIWQRGTLHFGPKLWSSFHDFDLRITFPIYPFLPKYYLKCEIINRIIFHYVGRQLSWCWVACPHSYPIGCAFPSSSGSDVGWCQR